ncbi:MAG TPA: hypothetical protein PKY97_04865, partial [Saprospiraceae bacterium]|nr:hypothetical protein [Saprospiraceae bacterium]
ISSTIGLFYYLRVVAAMLSRDEAIIDDCIGNNSIVLKILISALFVMIIWLGVYPSAFLSMIGL